MLPITRRFFLCLCYAMQCNAKASDYKQVRNNFILKIFFCSFLFQMLRILSNFFDMVRISKVFFYFLNFFFCPVWIKYVSTDVVLWETINNKFSNVYSKCRGFDGGGVVEWGIELCRSKIQNKHNEVLDRFSFFFSTFRE